MLRAMGVEVRLPLNRGQPLPADSLPRAKLASSPTLWRTFWDRFTRRASGHLVPHDHLALPYDNRQFLYFLEPHSRLFAAPNLPDRVGNTSFSYYEYFPRTPGASNEPSLHRWDATSGVNRRDPRFHNDRVFQSDSAGPDNCQVLAEVNTSTDPSKLVERSDRFRANRLTGSLVDRWH
jgi:hypothetical protein